MDQHLEQAMTCTYPTTLLQIPTLTQILVTPTNLHLVSAAPAPSWQELGTSLRLKWKYFILCRTDLSIFTVMLFLIYSITKLNSVHQYQIL